MNTSTQARTAPIATHRAARQPYHARPWAAAALLLALAFVGGCSDNPGPANPSFPVSFSAAARARADMAAHRPRLARPLVIVGGYLDLLDTNVNFARDYLRGVIDDDDRMLVVGMNSGWSFQDLRAALIDAVDRAFPSADPAFTAEVDVIGQSLGGLVARYAAAPSDDPARPRRLRVARLFTVGSPHRGASAAALGVTPFQRDLAPGSAFLAYVASHDAGARYELYAYALLGDWFVGPAHAAPPGAAPFWLASESWAAHPASQADPRIFADIARRLRGEAPLTQPPAAALPGAP